ncbi:MAG: response regulator [Verrucomicrobiota bacterium]
MNKILLIEDEDNMRLALSKRLRLEGYEVVTAADGEQGLRLARNHLPDLVLCDIMIPKLDGYGVLKAMRNEEQLAAIPVVFLTGLAEPEEVRKGMNIGADDYLIKPVEKVALLSTIEARLTKRKQDQHRNEHREEQVLQTLAGLMHDLRNPLAVVMSYAEFSDHTAASAGDAKAVIGAVESMDQQIRDIMVFAKTRFQKLPFQPVRLDLSQLCGRVVEELPEKKRVKLKAEVPECVILADPVQVRSAFINLLSNALKYSSDKQPVEVEVTLVGTQVRLLVRDQGRGISVEELPHIFDPFFRANNSAGITGHGLGLAMARMLVEKNGGKIHVNSKLGVGSEFWVDWAPAPSESSAKSARETTALVMSESADDKSGTAVVPSRRVLVVDDDAAARAALVRLIAHYPVLGEPVEVGSLAEAIRWLEQNRFELVFLDVQLPDGLGFELVSRMPRGTAIIFSSAYDEYAAKAIEYGPLDYLLKPVRRQQFDHALAKFFSLANHQPTVTPKMSYQVQKVPLPMNDGTHMVPVQQINMVKAYGEYSFAVLTGSKTAMIRKSLAAWEMELPYPDFVRVHRGAIINIHQVERIVRKKNRQIEITIKGDKEPIIASIRLAPRLKKALRCSLEKNCEIERT